ncbi:hypothetical protein [Microbacterium sp. MYb62]|uniref:hypothetical protein n=1 Tax=Microbacterium sp. MYb62 TaxID=1848690 RepID=UPI000CFD5845|nr:hypothetical protein [Microbacterium sp. MYb62]PRB17298.1 hypothetical protein CQ042_05750 [Microbacterium sp. MYb62]
MTDDETEETIILTRRDRRRAVSSGTDAAEAQPLVDADADADADADEATIVVKRAKAVQDVEPALPADETAASDEAESGNDLDDPGNPDEQDEPASLPEERDAPGEPEAFDVLGASDTGEAPEEVASLEAAESLDEATVVVDRAAAPKADAPDEATVVVSRPARRLRRKRADAAGAEESGPEDTGNVRRVESFAAPTDGPTPAIYKPRPAPLAPVAPPVVMGAAAPTRVEDPGLPSVAKQGQRWSLITLVAAAGACVVSAAGLVALGFVVFG